MKLQKIETIHEDFFPNDFPSLNDEKIQERKFEENQAYEQQDFLFGDEITMPVRVWFDVCNFCERARCYGCQLIKEDEVEMIWEKHEQYQRYWRREERHLSSLQQQWQNESSEDLLSIEETLMRDKAYGGFQEMNEYEFWEAHEKPRFEANQEIFPRVLRGFNDSRPRYWATAKRQIYI